MKTLIRKYMLVNASMAALFGLTLPVMSLALIDKGLSLIQLGTLMAVFTASAMFFEVPSGSLADSLGRKRVFLLGEIAMLLSTAGFWLASEIVPLMIVMFLTGLSRALLSGSLDALMVKQFHEMTGSVECGPEFLAAQAKIGATSSICLGLAAILGGFLPIWLAGPLDGSAWMRYYEINFVVILPLIALHFLLTLLVIEEPLDNKRPRQSLLAFSKETAAMTRESARLIMQSPLMLGVMAIQMISGAALEVVDVFWQPRLAQFIDPRGDSWLFGILCSISFVAMAAGHKSTLWLSRICKSQYLKLLLWLQLLMGISILFLAMQQHIAGFFLAYAVLYLINGAIAAPTLTVFHREADERLRSTLLSVKAFFLQAGALIAALVIPRIAQGYGIGTAWTIMGVTVLLGSLVYLLPAVKRGAGIARIGLATDAGAASSEVPGKASLLALRPAK